MKTKHFFKAITFIFTFVLVSCGGEPEGVTTEPTLTSITISTNATSVLVENGGYFDISVKGSDNANYTSSSTIYVNDVAIDGTIYAPTTVGSYSIYATKGDLKSNTITVQALSGVDGIVVNTNMPNVRRNASIDFTAADNFAVDITGDATFYVDGTVISGSSYSSNTLGQHEVYATYDSTNGTLTSPTITFKVITYTQKVLVEDYTGTWCGWCPRLAYNLEQAEMQDSSVIGVAVHNGDQMTYENEAAMRAQYGVSGFPSGRINRNINWNESVSQVKSYTGINADMGLAINSTLTGNTINVDIKVGYETATSGNKLVVYLLEDGLVYDQRNYLNTDSTSHWYQAGDPISGFVHNNTLRKAFTDIFGDNLPAAVAMSEYNTSFSLTVPSSVQDNSKLEIVAFVLGSNGTAINTQHAALGENKDFD